jgi:hypothetical protein
MPTKAGIKITSMQYFRSSKSEDVTPHTMFIWEEAEGAAEEVAVI